MSGPTRPSGVASTDDAASSQPHIIAIAYECGAFDPRLMRSGTASLVWNSALGLARTGHRVSVVTPAHGQAAYLREHHGASETGRSDFHTLPLELDPARWPGYPASPRPHVTTGALHLRRDGVDLYFLTGDHLDAYPATFYPDPADEGRDLRFCKPLTFQLTAVRFVRAAFGDEQALIQAHEPLHTYLVPPAFAADQSKSVVSTVATNHPVNTGVYAPQIRAALEYLNAPTDVDAYADPPADDTVLAAALRAHLPGTRLDVPAPRGYVSLLSLVHDHADGVDFLCEGQREFHAGFEGTPFEPRYRQLTVSAVAARNAHKHFVGGCAVSDSWLARDEHAVDRAEVLRGLGLDPALPTFYHAARYAVHHKGQLEMMRAVEQVLDEGARANFVIRCSAPAEAADPYFQSIADRYRGQLYLNWRMVGEDTLFEHAVAADYCLFPSKYELDTFLIAQGEAMACGAVPIATAQDGTRHFGHTFDVSEPDATGFAVARSFQEDDPLLTRALAERIREAITLITDEPDAYTRLSRNARDRAREFTWERSTASRAKRFRALYPPLPAHRPAAVPAPVPPAAPPPLGRANIRTHGDGWTLAYHCEQALDVAAFVDAGEPDLTAHPLTRSGDGGFGAVFRGSPPPEGLALLVTLERGRYHWELVPE
ncbi:glycogen/starch synthase (plasmid) [Streptomyces sp. NBC_00868]|uniref:glycosyltransferase n=1 Tax=Streptomyces sp. NBC_00868 TaxID=2903683 RepID=UPI002F91144F|nr:glycogen/starch synthase [Streptomyces sp. NBC_00868]